MIVLSGACVLPVAPACSLEPGTTSLFHMNWRCRDAGPGLLALDPIPAGRKLDDRGGIRGQHTG